LAWVSRSLLFWLFLWGLGWTGWAQAWELRVCADPEALPYSNRTLEGFDNKIAAILAEALGARLSYEWVARGPAALDVAFLREGRCDVLMGVGEGYRGLLSTIPYYQSSFVFVYREDAPYEIASLDDPILSRLRIAIETPGIPPFEALANRNLSKGAVILEALDPSNPHRSPIVEAVARGQVDVAILWGPVAGYFAARQPVRLKVVPLAPEFEPPALSMVYPLTLAVRPGDEALRDLLNLAIVRSWDQIQATLEAYGVPQVALPPPSPGEEDAKASLKKLRIGLVVPTHTGSALTASTVYEDAGEAARRGAIQASDELAERVDPRGFQVEVLPASAPSLDAARRAAERLIEAQGVQALIGGFGNQAEVLAQVSEGRGVLFLNIGDPSFPLRRSACSSSTFHVEASLSMYLNALIGWFSGAGLSRWFLVYQDSPEGLALYRVARASLLGHGVLEIDQKEVAPGQVDYTPVVEAIGAARPEAVLLLLDPLDQLAFMGLYEAAGLGARVLVLPSPIGQTRNYLLALAQVAPRAGSGERVALWEPTLSLAEAQALAERFGSRWSQPMDSSAWAAYAAVKVVVDSALATGSTDPTRIARYVADPHTRFDLYKGAPLAFRPGDHQLLQPLYLVQINPQAELGVRLSQLQGLVRLVGEVPEVSPGADPLPLLEQLAGPDPCR